MATMHYCALENTYKDLQIAYDKLNEPIESLSDDERRYRHYLLELCKQIAEEFEEEE